MKFNRVLAAAFVAAAALAACGGNTDRDGEGGGSQYISKESFAETFPTRFCDLLAACCDKLSYSLSESTCRNQLEQALTELVGGNATYDGTAAAECMNSYVAALSRCQVPDGDALDSCERITVGTVPEGGSCDEDSECAAGLYCYYDGARGACQSDGSSYVVAPGVEGEACNATCSGTPEGDADGGCGGFTGGTPDAKTCYTGQGLECNFTTFTCARLPELGQACTYDCAGNSHCYAGVCQERTTYGPCEYDEHCADGAYCDYYVLQCQPKRPDGADCLDGNECVNVCSDGTCAAAEMITGDVCTQF